MTIGRTQRLNLYTWSSGSDYFLTRLQENEMMQTLDDKVAIDMQGKTIAERPAATNVPRGTFWTDLQTGATYRSTGYVWVGLGANMASGPSGGNPAAEDFGVPGNVGVSGMAARSDHVHPMPSLSGDVPKQILFGGSGSAGTTNVAARADHVHPIAPAPTPPDTGWLALIPNSPNWVAQPGLEPYVRKVGNMVTLRGCLQYQAGGLSNELSVTLATLPGGTFPKFNAFLPAVVASGGDPVCNLMVITTGQLVWPQGRYRQWTSSGASIYAGMPMPLCGTWYTD